MTQGSVPFWQTQLGDEEVAHVVSSIREGHLSQGPVTPRFEEALAKFLGVPHVLCTTSGSVALFLAVKALGIGPGDEVIVPNRTFIATAHAVLLAGAKVRLVDTHAHDTIIEETLIEAAITPRTKAIMPVHLNGNSAEMGAINRIAAKHGLKVIEDSAQGFASKNQAGYLGTQSDIGCFSLGVTKFITTGQGGFVVTRRSEIYDKLIRLRTHGVHSTFASTYETFGLNFRYNDILASIGLVQLSRVPDKIAAHHRFYEFYEQGLSGMDHVKLLPVNTAAGNIPLWVEAMVTDVPLVIDLLAAEKIQVRPFLRDLNESPHLENPVDHFPNSKKFAKHGVFLPCGPDMPIESMERTIEALRKISNKVPKTFS